jgi:hypothetical protein
MPSEDTQQAFKLIETLADIKRKVAALRNYENEPVGAVQVK